MSVNKKCGIALLCIMLFIFVCAFFTALLIYVEPATEKQVNQLQTLSRQIAEDIKATGNPLIANLYPDIAPEIFTTQKSCTIVTKISGAKITIKLDQDYNILSMTTTLASDFASIFLLWIVPYGIIGALLFMSLVQSIYNDDESR